MDHERGGQTMYLNMKYTKEPTAKEESAEGDAAPTEMAIGTDGGFQSLDDQYVVTKAYTLVLFPDLVKIPIPCTDLPEFVSVAIDGVIKNDGSKKEEQVAAWKEDDEIKESKFARDLFQRPDCPKVSPDSSTWKCQKVRVWDQLQWWERLPRRSHS